MTRMKEEERKRKRKRKSVKERRVKKTKMQGQARVYTTRRSRRRRRRSARDRRAMVRWRARATTIGTRYAAGTSLQSLQRIKVQRPPSPSKRGLPGVLREQCSHRVDASRGERGPAVSAATQMHGPLCMCHAHSQLVPWCVN